LPARREGTQPAFLSVKKMIKEKRQRGIKHANHDGKAFRPRTKKDAAKIGVRDSSSRKTTPRGQINSARKN
jgi:hypothetical protein